MRLLGFLMSLVGLILCLADASAVQAQASLRASSGKIDITPTGSVFIAGYGRDRHNIGVHDTLMARCLVLESSGTRIAFVSCDLIGVPRYDVQQIRARVHSVLPDHLFISATHTHSGPDTLGQWGPDIQTSGVDRTWKLSFLDRVVQLIEQTASRLRPARIRFAHTTEVPRTSKNIRVPRILDTELSVMQLLAADKPSVIATLVNYACHPEILNTHLLSADFPHWLYATVEQQTGGVCLYLNGAQGGMVTADFDESTTAKGENWKAAETIGTSLGERSLQIIAGAPFEQETAITCRQNLFSVPMDNLQFKALIKLKVFPNDLKNGQIETEVNRITVGPAEFLTLPGEVLPNIGFYLKRHMTGEPRFLLGLTCDELGYILTKEDYGLDLYGYETSVSVGEEMGSRMVDQLLKAMALPRSANRPAAH